MLLDGASGVLMLPIAAELPLALLPGRRVVVAGDDPATWLVVGLTGAGTTGRLAQWTSATQLGESDVDLATAGLLAVNGRNVILDNNRGVRGKRVDAALATLVRVGTTDWTEQFSPRGTTGIRWMSVSSAELAQLSNAGDYGIGTTPNSRLHVAGPIATAFATKTAAYTLTATDSVIAADATAAPFTLALPTAVGIAGRQYTVKRVNAGVNAVTVDANGAQTIDGALTYVLTAQHQVVRLVSDGVGWLVV